MVNQLENFLSVGQLVQKCKDDIRNTLNGLRNLYQPCTYADIHEFTSDLIEVLNKVVADFIDESKPEVTAPNNDDASVIKPENDPDIVITIDSDDEMDIKEEVQQFIETEVTRFDQHNKTVIDPKRLNRSQSNAIAEQLDILGKNPSIDKTPASKIKSEKRPSQKLKLIKPNTKRQRRSSHETNDTLKTNALWKCSKCPKKFVWQCRLRVHEEKVHNTTSKKSIKRQKNL